MSDCYEAEPTTGLVCPKCLMLKEVCKCNEPKPPVLEMVGKGNEEFVEMFCTNCGKKLLSNLGPTMCNACDTKRRLE